MGDFENKNPQGGRGRETQKPVHAGEGKKAGTGREKKDEKSWVS